METEAQEQSRLKPMVHVIIVVLLMSSIVHLGLLDSVSTDTSTDHYAEKPWPVLKTLIPSVQMPANTLVNIGYVCAGIYWLLATKILVRAQARKGSKASTHVKYHDVYMMYLFCWIGILYAPVQIGRIMTLRHHYAIMDQWYTLPGFAFPMAWAKYLLHGWSPKMMMLIICASISSYSLALVTDIGFDIALGVHIIFVVKLCWDLQTKFGTSRSKGSFFKAILGCAGFVILKLADNYLASIHVFFSYLSGHFWSKICDALQVYYVAEFFFIITLEKARTHE